MSTEKVFKLLVINPGSTSTKLGVFENETLLLEDVVRHSKSEIDQFNTIADQKDMRLSLIKAMLQKHNVDVSTFDAIVGRGGLVEPIDSGVYTVNERMLYDLTHSTAASHASSLGGIIAAEFSSEINKPCYVVDPIVVDEMDPYAKLSGMPGIERRSVFHALNQKAVARRCAKKMGKQYEDCRFIVAHMGGGVTIGAHRYGRVIDVNDGLAGEGPFSPERTGAIPAEPLIRMCFSGAYTEKDLLDKVSRSGGMSAYLGTHDLRACERLIKEGDDFAALVLESMAYQVSKEIGAMFAVLEGRVDAIILTGGLAYSTRFTGAIKNRVALIADVVVFPGEDELQALSEGVLRVLRGEEKAREYDG
ncbi:butyrate kinase [Christensenellaceae bacterium OttesenSCG-928-L17]|nr:butyrate kinase [Christensenellaceae bacterium OttesenSCG-928-L17]